MKNQSQIFAIDFSFGFECIFLLFCVIFFAFVTFNPAFFATARRSSRLGFFPLPCTIVACYFTFTDLLLLQEP